jgi:hypothetical protein
MTRLVVDSSAVIKWSVPEAFHIRLHDMLERYTTDV